MDLRRLLADASIGPNAPKINRSLGRTRAQCDPPAAVETRHLACAFALKYVTVRLPMKKLLVPKRRTLLALPIAVAIAALLNAQATDTYKPVVGQAGKDVVWVPTPQDLVNTMLDMAKVTPQDVLMDLGSGDGRTVIAAAKRGVRAMGVEYNPEMVQLSKTAAATERVSDKATDRKSVV